MRELGLRGSSISGIPMRSTTNLGVWWRVLSCGDSFVPDLFFIIVFISSEFGRSGAVARDAFLCLASRFVVCRLLRFDDGACCSMHGVGDESSMALLSCCDRDASALIFSGYGSPLCSCKLISCLDRSCHWFLVTVPEETCSILVYHSVWSGLGGLRSSFQHPSTRVSLWWLRTARSRNLLGSCREASSVSVGFVLRMGVASLCWVRMASLSGLSVCIQSVVGSLGFVPRSVVGRLGVRASAALPNLRLRMFHANHVLNKVIFHNGVCCSMHGVGDDSSMAMLSCRDRDASALIFSGHGSPLCSCKLISCLDRACHWFSVTVPEETCSILVCHSVWSDLGGLRSSFQHPSTRVSLWWLRTARSRNSLGSCREASSVSAGFVLRMGVISLCWVRVASLSGLSVCIQSVVGRLGFVLNDVVGFPTRLGGS
ncbi:hypothetical protein F2Q69_00056173 [Brassica cretica]|uniref:Uncharacterized protein n=1 Tax=Brassica cretica TaxID=69181 RepID=A0A8S9MV25_BRACR|nr:hypothetical protein F2Q69_00056173 [Brassica cretica]